MERLREIPDLIDDVVGVLLLVVSNDDCDDTNRSDRDCGDVWFDLLFDSGELSHVLPFVVGRLSYYDVFFMKTKVRTHADPVRHSLEGICGRTA